MTREELLCLLVTDPVESVLQLQAINKQFQARIAELEAWLARLRKTPGNSSVPPAKAYKPNRKLPTDGPCKRGPKEGHPGTAPHRPNLISLADTFHRRPGRDIFSPQRTPRSQSFSAISAVKTVSLPKVSDSKNLIKIEAKVERCDRCGYDLRSAEHRAVECRQKELSPIDAPERIITLEDAYQEVHAQECYEFCTVVDFLPGVHPQRDSADVPALQFGQASLPSSGIGDSGLAPIRPGPSFLEGVG